MLGVKLKVGHDWALDLAFLKETINGFFYTSVGTAYALVLQI